GIGALGDLSGKNILPSETLDHPLTGYKPLPIGSVPIPILKPSRPCKKANNLRIGAQDFGDLFDADLIGAVRGRIPW
ncbi:hypothetical protein, partial [Escherichia coli]|uniref:hypothetical protein n=1 Tax=Escherichia coli TaxID=562 RepID=UPI001F4B8F0E